MKNIKKFEAFIIPRKLRRFHPWWKEEDIALDILDGLKSILKSKDLESIDRLKITEIQNSENSYHFEINDFEVSITTDYGLDEYGKESELFELCLDRNDILDVSDEVCIQIIKTIKEIKSINSESGKSKKDYIIHRRL